MFGLDLGMTLLLFGCILAAMAFEFINGFHDTANAVATVIYTRSLKPRVAVIWSGIFNFLGVYFGGIAVAIGIINLLPLEILLDQNISHNVAMVGSLILTAIIWNLGTWYFGIPCSSSHTLIGSIFGVGLAYLFISDSSGAALNWTKVIEAFSALLISPVVGFGLTILLMYILKKTIKKKKFFKPADPEKKPPFWVRLLLIGTCTTVSYSHGSNDGQKGVGLIMIILISLLPAHFALDDSKNPSNMIGNVNHIEYYVGKTDTTKIMAADMPAYVSLTSSIADLKGNLMIAQNPAEADKLDRFNARKDILTIKKKMNEFLSSPSVVKNKALVLNHKESKMLKKDIAEMDSYTEYAPWWVILMVSISLGLGTMIGWKRIVTTLGEKIGKSQMSYAQGASAQIVATATIMSSSTIGLPVSTTHVLSSGIAGSMVYQGGWKNLQMKTIYSILLTWVITIPVTIVMSGGLFLLIRSFL
ncbi:Low-affinity inorganic phosphate transporter 1 [anaerobic digester metagenome]